jgi:hypothetical protein
MRQLTNVYGYRAEVSIWRELQLQLASERLLNELFNRKRTTNTNVVSFGLAMRPRTIPGLHPKLP